MPNIKILSEAELRGCLALDGEAVACIEDCFRALATRNTVMPPIMSLDIPDHNGEVDVKTAYVPGLDSFAIKMSTGFFDNPMLGLPSLNGLMVLFSAKTGSVEAVLLDQGYLTDLRTAAAGAVAAKWLSREDAHSVGVIGAGLQARLQLKAAALVREIREVRVWARDSVKAARYADEMGGVLGISVQVCADAEASVRGSDIVVTTTPSARPLVEAGWLSAGQHVTAMGSDTAHKNELAPEVLSQADRYVCDRQSQCAVLGELHHAVEAGLIAADASFGELGQVIAGQAPGRVSADDITVCDLTGTGAQDTAIAILARRRAAEAGAGFDFEP